MLRVNVRGGYGGLACARDGMHGAWRKWNCVGSAGSASSVGCADKCVGCVDKCAGCVDKCASSVDKCASSVDKCVGSVDKSVGIVYTLK